MKVQDKEDVFDAVGRGVLKDILDLGIKGVSDVRFALLYYLGGEIDEAKVRRIAEELLCDKIVQEYAIEPVGHRPSAIGPDIIEAAYNPGVMDPSEESVLKAISDMGITGVDSVRTAKQYWLKGSISGIARNTITEELLYNKVIQHIVDRRTAPVCRMGRHGA